MPKRKYPWWGTVEAAIRGRMAVDKAIAKLQLDFPEIDMQLYCRMVYIMRTNTQEGAAALFGIDRRKANNINSRLHFYIAEEMGLLGQKTDDFVIYKGRTS